MPLSQELNRVQKSIIYIHRELFDESPSPMKLQKLCYYAQGYSLAEGRELFPEDFQAWQHVSTIADNDANSVSDERLKISFQGLGTIQCLRNIIKYRNKNDNNERV